VLFPAPLAPITPTIAARGTVKDTSSSAVVDAAPAAE